MIDIKNTKESDEMIRLIENLYHIERIVSVLGKKPLSYNTDELFHSNEVHTLKEIVKQNGIGMAELSKIMMRTKGATTAAVDKLMKKGLVIKKQSSTDLRRYELFATEKGLEIDRCHNAYDKKSFRGAIEKLGINQEQIILTNETLEKIVSHFALRFE